MRLQLREQPSGRRLFQVVLAASLGAVALGGVLVATLVAGVLLHVPWRHERTQEGARMRG